MKRNVLTMDEVAARLGVSRTRIRWLLMEGRLKGEKAQGSVWLIDLKSVEDYERKKAEKEN